MWHPCKNEPSYLQVEEGWPRKDDEALVSLVLSPREMTDISHSVQ